MSDREGVGGTTVIARTVTRTVVPLILVTAVALLLRGHNLPGGGFIAGVLTATAIALVYVVYGLAAIERDVLGRAIDRTDPVGGVPALYASLVGLGLALAIGSGLAAMVAGYPFLSQAVRFVDGVPLFDTLELASALAFDVGVYLVVVGAVLAILAVVGGE